MKKRICISLCIILTVAAILITMADGSEMEIPYTLEGDGPQRFETSL